MNEHQGYFEVFFCLMLLRPASIVTASRTPRDATSSSASSAEPHHGQGSRGRTPPAQREIPGNPQSPKANEGGQQLQSLHLGTPYAARRSVFPLTLPTLPMGYRSIWALKHISALCRLNPRRKLRIVFNRLNPKHISTESLLHSAFRMTYKGRAVTKPYKLWILYGFELNRIRRQPIPRKSRSSRRLRQGSRHIPRRSNSRLDIGRTSDAQTGHRSQYKTRSHDP